MLNYVTPVLETFDINKLKITGVFPSVDEDTKNIGKTFLVEKANVSIRSYAFKGKIWIKYSKINKLDKLYGKKNDLRNDIFELEFVKLKEDNVWKLVTYNGNIVDYWLGESLEF